jgi:tripartite-type tricarboxylate transporter receptor subunit TctC
MSSKTMIDRRVFLNRVGRVAFGAAGGTLAAPAIAQGRFPDREISWLIYQAPGGSIDTTARIIQPYLEKAGIRTTLDYALGAGGRVARNKLFTARPDGYMMMTESAPGAAIDEIGGRAKYRALDFPPIYGWSLIGWQICVKKDSPMRTFKDLVEETKKRRVVIGTIGRGASSHIQIAAIQKDLKLEFGLAHFEGSGKAYPAVMGGHVDAAISGPASGSRMAESLNFLCVTGDHREPSLPDVPTLKEQGFNVTPVDQLWYAMASPKVPDDRIQILTNAFETAFKDDAVNTQMKKAGESIRLLTRPQIEGILAKQNDAIVRFKDLLT